MRPITSLQWAIQSKAAYSSKNVRMLQCTELLVFCRALGVKKIRRFTLKGNQYVLF